MDSIRVMDAQPSVVLYDGGCGLCRCFARLLLGADRQRRLRLLPLQGTAGRSLAKAHGLDPDGIRIVAFVGGGGVPGDVMFKTDALLAALAIAGGPWRIARVLRMVPRRWRDAVYDGVARRHHLLAA